MLMAIENRLAFIVNRHNKCKPVNIISAKSELTFSLPIFVWILAEL